MSYKQIKENIKEVKNNLAVEIPYLKSSRHEDTNHLKKITDKEKKTIRQTLIILLLLYTSLNTKEYLNRQENIYNNNTLTLTSDEKEDLYLEINNLTGINEYNNDNILLLDAVIKNERLKDSEKAYIFNCSNLLRENPYLNKDEVYHAFRNLSIIYKNDEEKLNRNIKGEYNYLKHQITMYNIDINNEKYDYYLYHEIVHLIFLNETTRKLPNYFMEGVTELLTNEYFEESFEELENYPYEVLIVKQLCNMVGKDKVLESFTKGDINLITLELAKETSLEDSKLFMKNLEKLFGDYEYDYIVTGNNFHNVKSYIINYANKKYTADSNYESLEETHYNIELLSQITKKDAHFEYLNYIINNGVYVKSYLSTNLMKKYQHPFLDNKYFYLEIDDLARNLNKKK